MNTSPNLVPGELLKPKTATGWSMKVKLPGQPVKDAAIHTNAAKDADHDFSWDYPPETRQLIWKVQREILAVSITVVIEHINKLIQSLNYHIVIRIHTMSTTACCVAVRKNALR